MVHSEIAWLHIYRHTHPYNYMLLLNKNKHTYNTETIMHEIIAYSAQTLLFHITHIGRVYMHWWLLGLHSPTDLF